MKKECVTRKEAESIANSAVSNGVLTILLLLVVAAVCCANLYAAWRLDAFVTADHGPVMWAQLMLMFLTVALGIGTLLMLAER